MKIDHLKVWRVFEFRCSLLDFLKQPFIIKIPVLIGRLRHGKKYMVKWQS